MKEKSIIALVALALILSPLAFSQSRETGAITGKVSDEENNPLPGVAMTLTSPKLMGVRTTVTDALGEFRFPALPPGVYKIKAELQGFVTAVREEIRLTTTVTLGVDLIMKPTSLTEEINVIAQSPTVDVKSTETASVTLSNEILRNIPFNNASVSLVNMAPGITNDSAYGGSSGTGISWQMDGVGVGDPENGTAWVYLDSNIIEEAKIMAHGLPAEYGNYTGAIFNLVTKSGGNDFSGHVEFLFQGRKADSPKGLWQATNNGAYVDDWPDVTPPNSKLVDGSVHLGGPISKDKLWFYAGLQWFRTWDYPTGFPAAVDFKQPRAFGKLTAQPTSSLSMTFSVEYDEYNGINREGGATVAPEATTSQVSPEIVYNLGSTYILSPKTFLDFKAAMFTGYVDVWPRNGRDVSAHFYLDDNPALPAGNGNKLYKNAVWHNRWDRSRLQINASLTHYAEDFIKGNHDFKFGVEFENSKIRNRGGYNGPSHTYYLDSWSYGYSGPFLAYQYEGYDSDTRYSRLEEFAQDSWEVSNRLTVNFGVRLSQNRGSVRGQGTVYSTNRIAPRLGFTYDILGDKSTVLKAHYGQFTEAMISRYHDNMNTQFSDYVMYSWDLGAQKWVEFSRQSHGTWSIDKGIKHPYMSQFTIGIEREFFKNASFSVTYINRKWNNLIGHYNTLGTYEPVTVIVPELGRGFTIYDRTSGDNFNWVIANIKKGDPGILGDPYRKYQGVEILFNKRFSNRWQLIASYVYGKATGTIDNGTGNDMGLGSTTYDPNFWTNADGNLTNDPTHMIKVQASYLLPLGINFNAYFRGITGNSWTTQYRTRTIYGQGLITFFCEPRGSNHYPMQKVLDLRLEKTFSIATKYKLGLIFDVFNVFNADTLTEWGTSIGYDWNPGETPSTEGHNLYGILMPRQARLGIRLIF